jgi:signal transduction histidine kinase
LKKIIAHFRDITNYDNETCFEPLHIQSKDEIGVLADSFNGLGNKLQSLFDSLESKVRKRTCELQEANTSLQHKVSQCLRAEERANILAEEAMSANQAKTEFLTNMSHELRTPMNAIVGFSQVLSEEMSGREHLAYVNLITENSQKLLLLIDELLEYTRIESGKINIEIRNCNVSALVEEIESLLRPEAIKKGIDFEILQCDLIPEVILTDPLRLRQCLINLIENSIKFTEYGHVYVNVTMESRDDDSILWFDIEDTGIGIANEQLPKIFDVFTQADSAMTRKYGGTGLGLAITKHFIELLGGHISVRSTQGQGSVFTIQIPTGVQWPNEEAAVWNKYLPIDEINDFEKGTTMFNGKVLVAEDNPSNQKLIAILLQKMGFEVTLADNGLQALEQCGKQTFDIILMDMQMPTMNGYDATRQLRSEGVKTPIIAVTANAMTGDEEKCMDVGCDGYLSKPIDRNKLQELISQHLGLKVE